MVVKYINKPSVKENYEILYLYEESNFVLIKRCWQRIRVVIGQRRSNMPVVVNSD